VEIQTALEGSLELYALQKV